MVEFKTVATSPTIAAADEFAVHQIDFKFFVVEIEVAVQLEAFVVLSTVPPSPTAMPVDELVKWTLCKFLVLPLVSLVQVDPSVVLRIIPESPTAKPADVEVKKTEFKFWVVPLVMVLQLTAPFVVLTIEPAFPTA